MPNFPLGAAALLFLAVHADVVPERSRKRTGEVRTKDAFMWAGPVPISVRIFHFTSGSFDVESCESTAVDYKTCSYV